MDRNTKFDIIQSQTGACPKSDPAKMIVCIGIYSVFKGSVDHGGGVSMYIYILYTHTGVLYRSFHLHSHSRPVPSRFQIARPIALHAPLICNSLLSLGRGFGHVATELAQDLLLLLVRAVPHAHMQSRGGEGGEVMKKANDIRCLEYLTISPPALSRFRGERVRYSKKRMSLAFSSPHPNSTPDSAYVHVGSGKRQDEATAASSRMPVGEVGGEDGGVTGGVLAAVVHEAWQSEEASKEG